MNITLSIQDNLAMCGIFDQSRFKCKLQVFDEYKDQQLWSKQRSQKEV